MSDDGGGRFAAAAPAAIELLRGEPNKDLSSRHQLRWGNGGSLSLDVKTGQIYDHEQGEGGGLIWFVQEEMSFSSPKDAFDWLAEQGLVEDQGRDSPPERRSGRRDSGPPPYHPDDPGPNPDPGPAQRTGPRTDPEGNWVPQNLPDGAFLAKTYDYTEADGSLAYQVCRYEWPDEASEKGHGKHFLQRIPDPSKKHGYRYKTKGMKWLPYRLPELLDDIDNSETIFIVEGEKKVDMLRDLGAAATCNHGGAGKFPESLCSYFTGARVCILPDNDTAGQDHAVLVGRRLRTYADEVLILNLPDLPPKGGVDDWLPAGGTLMDLYGLVASDARPFVPPPPKSKFGGVPWSDLDKPGPSLDYIIKNVLASSEVSLLVGESQSGKSFLAIDIAMAVARGVDFFGHKCRQGGVIYQAGESAIGVRRRRLPAYRDHYDLDLRDPLPFVLLEQKIDLYGSDDDTSGLIEECLEWRDTFDVPLDLIVVDTFNRATPGANENDGKDMTLVLERCDRIRQETGAHVMLVHHMNAGGTRARGHTSLTANVDTAIWVRKLEDEFDGNRQVREWLIQKQKDGEAGKAYRFVLPAIPIGKDADGDEITSCIVAAPSDNVAATGTFERPTDASSTGIVVRGKKESVLRVIYDAIRNRGEDAPSDLPAPAPTRVVARSVVVEMVQQQASIDGLDATEIKAGETEEEAGSRLRKERAKQFVKARDDLISSGIIGVNEDWVWLKGVKVRGFGPAPGHWDRHDDPYQDDRPIDLPFDQGDFE